MSGIKVKCLVLLGLAGLLALPPDVHPQEGKPSPILKAMKQELDRSAKGLKEKGDPPPYFISYHVTETRTETIHASFGAIVREQSHFGRQLDVDVRVGDYSLDNTHRIKGKRGFFGFPFRRPVAVPVEDDPDGLRSILWIETDRRYKTAVKKLGEVKRDITLKVKEEDESDDFSREKAHRSIGPLASVRLDDRKWTDRVREYSRLFIPHSQIHESSVYLRVTSQNKYFVNTEGTEIQHGQTFIRLSLSAQTTTEDGMKLRRFESFDASSEKNLPGPKEVKKAIHKMTEDLLALRRAPLMEPYTGPAILSGKTSGVFFHEIFGHRIEGHRQKDERDGQTFTKKIGQAILPDFISVYDDPTITRAAGTDLRGHYLYDDQGMPAQRVVVVENGVLKNFLMSRTPLAKFGKSNGHGRGASGFNPAARQGNLIVRGSKSVSERKLRLMLIEECRKQNKPYGLLFTEVEGGFTFTGRGFPQVFDLRPIMVYRIYADGRPDELVRGVELIGTPLTSFSKILATSDKIEVFNGTCGAESGPVPVSSVAPSMLTTQIEVQKKEKSLDRPPLLPPPERGSR